VDFFTEFFAFVIDFFAERVQSVSESLDAKPSDALGDRKKYKPDIFQRHFCITIQINVFVTRGRHFGAQESELFGPGHFVGLGLRLKSEIRTRART
jgi:hypothetical protein